MWIQPVITSLQYCQGESRREEPKYTLLQCRAMHQVLGIECNINANRTRHDAEQPRISHSSHINNWAREPWNLNSLHPELGNKGMPYEYTSDWMMESLEDDQCDMHFLPRLMGQMMKFHYFE